MTADNMSGRDPLSPAEEENALSEENETANSSHQGTGKVLAVVLSAMTQTSSTTLSMESDSGYSEPEKSDSEELNFQPYRRPDKTRQHCHRGRIAQ